MGYVKVCLMLGICVVLCAAVEPAEQLEQQPQQELIQELEVLPVQVIPAEEIEQLARKPTPVVDKNGTQSDAEVGARKVRQFFGPPPPPFFGPPPLPYYGGFGGGYGGFGGGYGGGYGFQRTRVVTRTRYRGRFGGYGGGFGGFGGGLGYYG